MRNHVKRTVLVASLAMLPFTAACTAKDDATPTKNESATAPQQQQPVPGTEGTAPGAPDSKVPAGGPGDKASQVGDTVTAQNIADYEKVVACAKANGVTMAAPVVGKPFDNTAMNQIAMTPKWNTVLAKCPDYTRVVIGVG